MSTKNIQAKSNKATSETIKTEKVEGKHNRQYFSALGYDGGLIATNCRKYQALNLPIASNKSLGKAEKVFAILDGKIREAMFDGKLVLTRDWNKGSDKMEEFTFPLEGFQMLGGKIVKPSECKVNSVIELNGNKFDACLIDEKGKWSAYAIKTKAGTWQAKQSEKGGSKFPNAERQKANQPVALIK